MTIANGITLGELTTKLQHLCYEGYALFEIDLDDEQHKMIENLIIDKENEKIVFKSESD